MKAVAAHAPGLVFPWQPGVPGNRGQAVVERRVEAGELGHVGKLPAHGGDAGQVMWQVQRSQWNQSVKSVQQGGIDPLRAVAIGATMDPPVTDADQVQSACLLLNKGVDLLDGGGMIGQSRWVVVNRSLCTRHPEPAL